MTEPLEVFIAESNVDLFLSKAYTSRDAAERDVLLGLTAQQESKMGRSREHLENGQRRLEECRERIRRQRELVGSLRPDGNRGPAEFMLETFEQALLLIEQHQRHLEKRFDESRL